MPSVTDDIDDIEDLVAAGDLKPSDRYHNKKDVTVRGKKDKKINGNHEAKIQNGNAECESVSFYNKLESVTVIKKTFFVDDSGITDSLLENLGMFT